MTDELGTQYLHARLYDAGSMRLMSVDPEPRFNAYHYANLNPITYADPTGRLPALPTWASAVLAGAGLLMAGIGLVGAVGAYMTAAATAAVAGTATVGSKIALGTVVAVAAYDVAATALTAAHEFDPEFLDDDVAFALGASAAVLGGVTMVASLAARSIGRIEINALMARDELASEVLAVGIVRAERRMVNQIYRAYRDLGVKLDKTQLRTNLHRWASKAATEDAFGEEVAWSARAHYSALQRRGGVLNNAQDAVSKQVGTMGLPLGGGTEVTTELGDKLAAMKKLMMFEGEWPGMDLTSATKQAYKNLTDELKAATDVNRVRIHPEGVHRSVQYEWKRKGGGWGVFVDREIFGKEGLWNFYA